jgi:hypothetical protein
LNVTGQDCRKRVVKSSNGVAADEIKSILKQSRIQEATGYRLSSVWVIDRVVSYSYPMLQIPF